MVPSGELTGRILRTFTVGCRAGVAIDRESGTIATRRSNRLSGFAEIIGRRRQKSRPEFEIARATVVTVYCDVQRAVFLDSNLDRAPLSCPSTTLASNLCCLLYTSPSPRDATLSRMPSSA